MQFTAKTMEEAIEAGLKELGIDKDHADIVVLEEPTKGLFGRLKGKAVVDIVKKDEEDEEKGKGTVEFVQKLVDILGLKATATLTEEGESTVITLETENATEVIGYRGEVLDAIQTLAGAKENIGNKAYKKVVVDCENYRNKREDTLISLAHKLEAKATEMRREVLLEPMSPYERRIIHTALAESATVTTKSEGKEPNRYVIIVPNDKDEFSRPYNAGRNNDRGRERRGGHGGRRNNDRRGGNRDGGRRKSGFVEERKKTSSFGFGTYLGNSRKDN